MMMMTIDRDEVVLDVIGEVEDVMMMEGKKHDLAKTLLCLISFHQNRMVRDYILRSYIDWFLLASTQKAPSSKTQKSDNRSGQEASASNQPRISSAMQVNLFSLRLTLLEVLFDDPRNKYFRTKPVTKF